jgi:predicted glycogen debranching enzyme
MSYINFDKHQLVNLEYSLNKELLRANRSGSHSCTTLIHCNTRKYHGLLVCPVPNIDDEKHVLLSAIDETIEQHGEHFNLGLHQFEGGKFSPKGHKYLREFSLAPLPKKIFNVGGVLFSKETLYAADKDCLIIKYTLEEAHSKTKLIVKPFLAFRNIHCLSKANNDVNENFEIAESGIRTRMYDAYPDLYMQFSKKVNYKHHPDWYYNIEYQKELDRGYDGLEDLYVSGTFEVEIKKGESIYFSVGLEEIKKPETTLKKMFADETKNRIPRDSFEGCLKNAARQFFVKNENGLNVIAGFPWFGSRSRDTFIALPGLTLTHGGEESCKQVLDNMVSKLHNGWFPDEIFSQQKTYSGIDTQLWFFWALQQYAYQTKTEKKIWKEYGEAMVNILNMYKHGSHFHVHMIPNGLIYGGCEGQALTWMNALAEGIVVTPRIGFAVEVNALWYNAVMFAIETAKLAKDKKFVDEWQPLMENFPNVFKDMFWEKERGYLADVVNGDFKDFSVRPNQVIATGLPYSPISNKISQLILEKTRQELLTPRGLRTLSPKDQHYKSVYEGNAFQRDMAYHQGTVWVWLLQFFVEGYINIYGESKLDFVKDLYHGFEQTISEYCVGSIAEIYDGDPPHRPKGAISQAWSVGALLRINQIIAETLRQTQRPCNEPVEGHKQRTKK